MHTDPEALLRSIPRENALCFTGHRPEKLPQGEMLAALLRALYYQIDLAINAGLTCFYTGMADGIDYEAALYVFSRRRTNPALRVIGVTPCSDYRTFYENHGYCMSHLWTLEQGVDLHVTLPGTWRQPGVFLTRNRFMVDHSAAVIAVCRDGRSGSAQTLRYARSKGLAWCRLHPETDSGIPAAPPEWPSEQMGL